MFPTIEKNKKFHTPRARLCYICGRQTLIAGFSHHVEGCSKLFLQREALKPPRERRPLPADPMLSMGNSFDGALNVGNNLDQINALSQQAYDATLSVCQFCGRKFLPEKLVIHNRSCRADNPARRVDESVNRRAETQPPNAFQPSFPSPSQYKSQTSSRQLLGNNNNNGGNNNNGSNSSRQSQSQRPGSSSGFNGNSNTNNNGNNGGSYGNDAQIKGASSQYPQDYGEDFTPAMMMQCPDCGRKFNEVAYERHVKICKKVFIDKRKEFDSHKHRVEGTEMASVPTNRRGQASNNNNNNNNNSAIKSAKHSTHQSNSAIPKWKADSDAFRQAMKQARTVSLAQKKSQETGIPLAKLLPNKPSDPATDPVYAGYIQCPTCGRRFNETAGARHIPKCQDILNKPSRLKAHSGQQATTSTLTAKYRR